MRLSIVLIMASQVGCGRPSAPRCPHPIDVPYYIDGHLVRIDLRRPNAIERGLVNHCTDSESPATGDVSAPLVAFIVGSLAPVHGQLVRISLNTKGDVAALRSQLQRGQYGVLIENSLVVVYTDEIEQYYCQYYSIGDEIRIDLDLFKVRERLSRSIPQPGAASGTPPRTFVTEYGAPQPGGTGPVRVDFNVSTQALQPAGRADWFTIFNESRDVPIHDVIITRP